MTQPPPLPSPVVPPSQPTKVCQLWRNLRLYQVQLSLLHNQPRYASCDATSAFTKSSCPSFTTNQGKPVVTQPPPLPSPVVPPSQPTKVSQLWHNLRLYQVQLSLLHNQPRYASCDATSTFTKSSCPSFTTNQGMPVVTQPPPLPSPVVPPSQPTKVSQLWHNLHLYQVQLSLLHNQPR